MLAEPGQWASPLPFPSHTRRPQPAARSHQNLLIRPSLSLARLRHRIHSPSSTPFPSQSSSSSHHHYYDHRDCRPHLLSLLLPHPHCCYPRQQGIALCILSITPHHPFDNLEARCSSGSDSRYPPQILLLEFRPQNQQQRLVPTLRNLEPVFVFRLVPLRPRVARTVRVSLLQIELWSAFVGRKAIGSIRSFQPSTIVRRRQKQPRGLCSTNTRC